MIATQGSTARDLFARTFETARRQLRETIQENPNALPVTPRSDSGAFPAMLSIIANHLTMEPGAQSQNDAAWWSDQALRYSQFLVIQERNQDPAGLGLVFLPEALHGDVYFAADLAARVSGHLGSIPTLDSLLDALLVFQSTSPDLRAAATAHCLAARRLLVRGDGSLTAGGPREVALAIHAFAAAYKSTRDPRFLGTAESCAVHLLENSEEPAGPIAPAALLQLSALAPDAAKSRLYSLCARQLLMPLLDAPRHQPSLEAYFFLNALDRLTGRADFQVDLLHNGTRNGAAVPLVPIPEPESPAPEPEPQPVEPESEIEAPRRKRVRPVVFLLAPLIFYLLIELLVFRTNYYTRFIEPDSQAGTFEGAFEHEMTRPRHPNEIIILGSSRIAEGFSAKIVNLAEPKGGYYFANGAVPGAGARPMYYLVRDIDPQRNRYKALVMTIDDYTDPDDYEDYADRVQDLNTVIARLHFSDIREFMLSFTTHQSKMEVLRGALLKNLVYQRDLQEFLDHPSERLARAALYRADRYNWAYDYVGSPHSLAGTTIDWTTNTITFPATISKPDQDYLRPRLILTAPQNGRVRAYQTRWLGALADLYKNSATRLIFIQAPRTPLPRPAPIKKWDWTTVDALAKRPWVTIVDAHAFEYLERPELFLDYAHLNAEGQRQFSPALAAKIKEILAK